MTAIPRLETSRLFLREHTLQDFEALYAMWSEPAVYRFIVGRPSTREEAWNRLLRYSGHWALLGYGYWVVEERATGYYVGEMGFADFHRGIDPPLDGKPELGWALKTAVHGKGYATEALLAITAWGDAHFAVMETAAIIAPENTASIRLAEKIGFVRKLETTYKGEPTLVFYRAPKS
ncbi:MAG: GNAT family N-acetyltransferase [Aestuariivirga sp.]|nr:GNAT family N-acetyltransferase [Aestuariivirga sp.]